MGGSVAALRAVSGAIGGPCSGMRTRYQGHRWAPTLLLLATSACGMATPRIDTAADALLARSVAFHDPTAVWGHRGVALTWVGSGSEGQERVALDISLDPDGRTFSMTGRYAGSTIDYATTGTAYTVTVDGTAELSDETRQRMRLDREDGLFWRSYFGFLAGLPMKLFDPGTHVDPEPEETEFEGRPARAIRVTYDPEIGGETWYFYLDPETDQLVGCRFYYDESLNDGEYIVFTDLIEAGGLRLPRHRSWYTNAEGEFLGADEITRLAVSGAASGETRSGSR